MKKCKKLTSYTWCELFSTHTVNFLCMENNAFSVTQVPQQFSHIIQGKDHGFIRNSIFSSKTKKKTPVAPTQIESNHFL